MSSFICEKCGTIDNSACNNNYWMRKIIGRKYSPALLLCTSCTAKENGKPEIWHNQFPKRHWSECGTKEELIKECKNKNGNVVNAIEYFKNLKGE